MWGPWMGITAGGLFAVLLLIAIAFGTTGLLIPVLLVGAFGVFAGLAYIGSRAAGTGRNRGRLPTNPVEDAAPASATGVDPPPPNTPPSQAP